LFGCYFHLVFRQDIDKSDRLKAGIHLLSINFLGNINKIYAILVIVFAVSRHSVMPLDTLFSA